MESPREENPTLSQLEAFLGTLRRSAELAQELLRTSAQQAERIRSLDADLASAHGRIGFLEAELGQVRSTLAPGPSAELGMLEELVEDQNCLAHMFVTSDRLARVASVADAVQAAVEVLHNLVGAHRYGVFVRVDDGGAPLLVAPLEERYRQGIAEYLPQVEQLLKQPVADRRASPRSEDAAPLCVPLNLHGQVVGALMIVEFVPQSGARLQRIQQELLSLLSERLAASMCLGAFHQAIRDPQAEPWAAVRQGLTAISERLR